MFDYKQKYKKYKLKYLNLKKNMIGGMQTSHNSISPAQKIKNNRKFNKSDLGVHVGVPVEDHVGDYGSLESKTPLSPAKIIKNNRKEGTFLETPSRDRDRDIFPSWHLDAPEKKSVAVSLDDIYQIDIDKFNKSDLGDPVWDHGSTPLSPAKIIKNDRKEGSFLETPSRDRDIFPSWHLDAPEKKSVPVNLDDIYQIDIDKFNSILSHPDISNTQKCIDLITLIFFTDINEEASKLKLCRILADLKHDFYEKTISCKANTDEETISCKVNTVLENYTKYIEEILETTPRLMSYKHYFGDITDLEDINVKITNQPHIDFINNISISSKLKYKMPNIAIKKLDINTEDRVILFDQGINFHLGLPEKFLSTDGLIPVTEKSLLECLVIGKNIMELSELKEEILSFDLKEIYKYLLQTWLQYNMEELINIIILPRDNQEMYIKLEQFKNVLSTNIRFSIEIDKTNEWVLSILYAESEIFKKNITNNGQKRTILELVNSDEMGKLKNEIIKQMGLKDKWEKKLVKGKLLPVFDILFLSLKTFGDKSLLYIIVIFIIINNKISITESPINFSIATQDIQLINSYLIDLVILQEQLIANDINFNLSILMKTNNTIGINEIIEERIKYSITHDEKIINPDGLYELKHAKYL
jgi:hypothetical protein